MLSRCLLDQLSHKMALALWPPVASASPELEENDFISFDAQASISREYGNLPVAASYRTIEQWWNHARIYTPKSLKPTMLWRYLQNLGMVRHTLESKKILLGYGTTLDLLKYHKNRWSYTRAQNRRSLVLFQFASTKLKSRSKCLYWIACQEGDRHVRSCGGIMWYLFSHHRNASATFCGGTSTGSWR